MHYNNKLDENISKTLIQRNIHPLILIKKLIIYYNKFKTTNLGISNTRLESFKKTNVMYQFKCPLGDCISENNNTYVDLTSTNLSCQLTMQHSDTTSIARHLKNFPALKMFFEKFLPKTQQY